MCCVSSALELFNFSAEVGQLLLDHPTTVLAGMDIQTPQTLEIVLPSSLFPVCDESLQRTLSAINKTCGNRPLSVRHLMTG